MAAVERCFAEEIVVRGERMASPFPGMDPYLEEDEHWPTFQHHFVSSLYHLLSPNLMNVDRQERYRVRVGQRRYTIEMPLFTSIIREEHGEEFLEIRQKLDGQLVTLVDVVSPRNKTRPEGRTAYWERRRDAQAEGANLVEIDLVLQGEPLLDYCRDNLPEWDYLVTVVRKNQPERYEIYTSTLKKRLPRFKLPLLPGDTDVVVDLQIALNRSYEEGGFADRIDYGRPPKHVTSETHLKWLDELLEQTHRSRR